MQVPEPEKSIRILKQQCFKTRHKYRFMASNKQKNENGNQQLKYKKSTNHIFNSSKFKRLIKLRSLDYPVQYLCRSWPFRDLNLKLKSPILIPRYESEYMIDILGSKIKQIYTPQQIPKLSFVEYGCGSGALGLSLIKQYNMKGIMIDINPKCIELTHINAQCNNIQKQNLTLIEGDMLEQSNHKLMNYVDIVISNPPYLSQDHYHRYLNRQIKKYEDTNALVAQNNGMRYVNALVSYWMNNRVYKNNKMNQGDNKIKKGICIIQFDGRELQNQLQQHVVLDQYGRRRYILFNNL